jgi:hypothetical protein
MVTQEVGPEAASGMHSDWQGESNGSMLVGPGGQAELMSISASSEDNGNEALRWARRWGRALIEHYRPKETMAGSHGGWRVGPGSSITLAPAGRWP